MTPKLPIAPAMTDRSQAGSPTVVIADWVSPSDCFSYPIPSTTSWRPEETRWSQATATLAPTVPPLLSLYRGLPAAPRAAAIQSSGKAMPSNSSMFPTTTASILEKSRPLVARQRSTASRTISGIDTSRRRDAWSVWPTATMADALPISPPPTSRHRASGPQARRRRAPRRDAHRRADGRPPIPAAGAPLR